MVLVFVQPEGGGVITVNGYFDKVMVIASEHRGDRLQALRAQLCQLGIEFTIFPAHWKPIDHNGQPNGNMGCTASHRGIMELIRFHGWKRTLIFEDDAKFLDGFQARFAESVSFVPDDWAMLYLGGHYGEMPQGRVNLHCIRVGRMLTTHAYAVTAAFANKVAPDISGVGPIDSLYGKWNISEPCYCLDPRLVIQAKGYSDLQEKFTDYEWVYTTRRHTWGELP